MASCLRVRSYPGGVIELHLSEQLAVDAEVAETASLVVDDAVTFTGDGNESRLLAVLWAFQGPQKIPCDGVYQAWTL